jgi:hypothetical protein
MLRRQNLRGVALSGKCTKIGDFLDARCSCYLRSATAGERGAVVAYKANDRLAPSDDFNASRTRRTAEGRASVRFEAAMRWQRTEAMANEASTCPCAGAPRDPLRYVGEACGGHIGTDLCEPALGQLYGSLAGR